MNEFIKRLFQGAITEGDVDGIRRQFEQYRMILKYPLDDGDTWIHKAVHARQPLAIPVLVGCGFSPNLLNNMGKPPLFVAIQREADLTMVNALPKSGANPNLRNDVDRLRAGGFPARDQLAIHLVVKRPEIVRLLLKHGANPNAIDEDKQTPLHIAAYENQLDVALQLLQSGANPNAIERMGLTPLHIAARKGQREFVLALLERGADPLVQTLRRSMTPADEAKMNGHVSLAADIDAWQQAQRAKQVISDELHAANAHGLRPLDNFSLPRT